ncbi:MAG TPA: EamA family transporter [Candidatus Limnocylindrales bacterium]|nr:EamA family transporter [Candidatus Limnocylindrales bacterium]
MTGGLQPELVFGLGAAMANVAVAVLSTRLAARYPARQLLGPLFILNCLLLLPLAPFVSWVWTPTVVALHLGTTVALVASSVAIWDMYDAGGAAPTVTAQSVAPLPAVLLSGILVPGSVGPGQAIAAVVVVAGVLVALRDAFGDLGRRRTAVAILVAAVGTGVITVFGRLLSDNGAGVVEAYVVRTALAAACCLVLFPPRDVPWRVVPRFLPRAVAITLHLTLVLLGVQGGNPAVVQTMVATGPLFVFAYDAAIHRRRPTVGLFVGALIAFVGVAIIAFA